MKALLQTTLFFFLGLNFCNAQWKPAIVMKVSSDTIFSIKNDRAVQQKKVKFYFPEFDPFGKVGSLISGYQLSADTAIGNNAIFYASDFKKGIALKTDTTFITLRLFLKNVSSYTVTYHGTKSNLSYSKTFPVENAGYQIPVIEPLTDWKSSPASPEGRIESQISISCLSKNSAEPPVVVVGELLLDNRIDREMKINHPYFDIFTDPSKAPSTDQYFKNFKLEFIKNSVYGFDNKITPSNITLKALPNENINEQETLKRLVLRSAERYPFYAERKLDSVRIRKDLLGIFSRYSQPSTYCNLQKELSEYLKKAFDDLHFSLDIGSSCKIPGLAENKRSPVRMVEINNKFFIAGAFDKRFSTLTPGDEVVAVNRQPVGRMIDSISQDWYKLPFSANTPYKKNMIVQYALDRPATDSARIEVRDATNHLKAMEIYYNKPLTIGKNFRSEPFILSAEDTLSYIKIGNWSPESIYKIFNSWQQIGKSKAVIIDLRGNGGGDLNLAMQLFSLFIDKPQNFIDVRNNENKIQHLVVMPNENFKSRQAQPVFILQDYATACASESFIRAMSSYYKNCKTVGASSTYGTLSVKYRINLPSGTVLNTNALFHKFYFNNKIDYIEYRGLKPDYLIAINAVNELKPYQDKVLSTAVGLAKKNGNPGSVKVYPPILSSKI